MTTEADIEYSEPEPGVYPAVFMGIRAKTDVEDAGSPTGFKTLWVWQFQVDDTTKFDALTSTTFAPRSNALKLFTGILGRVPVKGDKPNDYIGVKVNAIYGPNQNGKLTVTDVLPLKAGK